jgi:predicted nucleotidyltransferase
MDENQITEAVRRIIRKHIGLQARIFLFGSRAKGTCTNRSDYDFGIDAGAKLPLDAWERVEADVEDLPTLHRIDIVDFWRVSKEFMTFALEHARALE